MAVWELIRDAIQTAHDRGQPWLTVGEITREVLAIDQGVNKGTIHGYVRYLCINDPSKKHAQAPLYRTNPLFVTDDPTMRGKRYRLLMEDERRAFLSNPRDDLEFVSYSQLMDSIHTKLMILPDNTIVYPGHGPDTTIGTERQGNPFLRG